jgi:hypothetical protein
MSSVLLPRRNEKDLEEIPAEVMRQLRFHYAESVLDALAILFPHRSFETDEPLKVDGHGVVDLLRRERVEAPDVQPTMDQPTA